MICCDQVDIEVFATKLSQVYLETVVGAEFDLKPVRVRTTCRPRYTIFGASTANGNFCAITSDVITCAELSRVRETGGCCVCYGNINAILESLVDCWLYVDASS